MRTLLAVVGLAVALMLPAPVRAQKPILAPTLTLTFGPETRNFTAAELLARPDAATLQIPADVAYHRPMTYRAVPLLALLGKTDDSRFDTLEARATDGFASQIPLALVKKGADGGSTAWIAVEDPAAPWPHLPGKSVGAGPFYLVWAHPERSGVGSEQWPYQLASLTGVQSPAQRWPQMAVDASLPADAPARRGQAVFTTQCLPCHRMKGAGAADVGPDLGQPMNPTQYMTPVGLRALIRDPKAVRTWPQQEMPGFDEATLPEADLDALLAYLAAMAKSKR
jgi:mono/diheme cytochrome c family protein